MPTKTKTMPPVHPGETLREDFLKPLGLTANRLAAELFVPVTRINDIVRCRRAITADTALRFARYFGTTPQFWINLQSNYDLALAQDVKGSEISGGRTLRPRNAGQRHCPVPSRHHRRSRPALCSLLRNDAPVLDQPDRKSTR